MSRHIYTMKKPAAWHKELWREALPLGNGLTGVLIPGAIGKESITFTRHDLWEGGSDNPVPDVTDTFRKMREALDRGDYAAANQNNLKEALLAKGYADDRDTPYPVGWLQIDFEPPGLFYHYRRGVNMQTGEAFVRFESDGCNYLRRCFVSRATDVTVLRFTADRPFTMQFRFDLYREAGQSEIRPDGLFLRSADGDSAVNVHLAGSYSSTVLESSLEVTGSDYMLLIRCSSNGSDSSLEGVLGKTYEELLAEHVALHRPLYDAVSIELAPEEDFELSNEEMLDQAYDDKASLALLERLWRFGRYLFISAANEAGNPVPLYGLWHGKDHLTWSQYVANENVEITYWHVLAGGLAYSVPALLRYYTGKTKRFQECARNLFGCRGIWVSAYTTPHASGVPVPVAVISDWISCAGWLCHHFWDYYIYTKDDQLLREEILPFMYQAALFYRDYIVQEGDSLRIYPSVSPENTPEGFPGVVAQDATMDYAILKELLTNLLEGIRITGMYQDEADSFRQLLSRIAPYQINADGAVREWMNPDIPDHYYHRHLSHLYPVFPGTEVTQSNQPELWKAFEQAVHLRKLGAQSGWSLAHMANIYARMHDGERAAECLDGMTKSVVLNSLLTVHNDWRNMGTTVYWHGAATLQLDADFGAVNAIQEMLFCRQPDALSFLPALPDRLPCGMAKGLVFPEGTADVAWNESGEVDITITAVRPVETALLVCGKAAGRIHLAAGEKQTYTFRLPH